MNVILLDKRPLRNFDFGELCNIDGLPILAVFETLKTTYF